MAHKISKDLVLETLRRTENLNDLSSSVSSDIAATTASYHPNNSTIQVDEETGVANYAKTSEIISFPDKGKYKRLLKDFVELPLIFFFTNVSF